jgi:hypothetical protein
MLNLRIHVGVVGFSDVERHALNTIFRLSEGREIAYAPWVPLVAQGSGISVTGPEVVLVDGESAEAVLFHAKPSPEGQRVIWIGDEAPEHAWRVLSRPISWSSLLEDLDAVYAARQVDSGFLDLDITSPGELDDLADRPQMPIRRALLVGLDVGDSTLLRGQLAAVGVEEVDAPRSTEQAVDWISRHEYQCGAFNIDNHQVDAWLLSRLFAESNPHAMNLGLSEHASPLAAWWSRRRVRKDSHRSGINALVSRPLSRAELLLCMDRLR